jgi:hypothetical protein
MLEGHRILVSPVPGGWSVDCPVTDNVLVFASGARAEQAARSLGACLAGLGHDIRVAVHDRHGALIGTAHYFPLQQPDLQTPASGHIGSALAVA